MFKNIYTLYKVLYTYKIYISLTLFQRHKIMKTFKINVLKHISSKNIDEVMKKYSYIDKKNIEAIDIFNINNFKIWPSILILEDEIQAIKTITQLAEIYWIQWDLITSCNINDNYINLNNYDLILIDRDNQYTIDINKKSIANNFHDFVFHFMNKNQLYKDFIYKVIGISWSNVNNQYLIDKISDYCLNKSIEELYQHTSITYEELKIIKQNMNNNIKDNMCSKSNLWFDIKIENYFKDLIKKKK